MKTSVFVSSLILTLVFFCALTGFAQADQKTEASAVTKAENGTIFNIPATGTWVKVQSGGVTQWSAIPPTAPETRIDLVSYVKNGNRITYFLIRSACSDGTVGSAVIKQGNKLGTGLDCNGHIVATEMTSVMLGEVEKLPREAAVLLKR